MQRVVGLNDIIQYNKWSKAYDPHAYNQITSPMVGHGEYMGGMILSILYKHTVLSQLLFLVSTGIRRHVEL